MFEGSGEYGEGEGEGGTRTSGGVSSAITSAVDPAPVDIDTELGLQGGEAAGTGMVVSASGAIDGSPVDTPAALTELVLRGHPGDSVAVTWQTPAGVQQTTDVTLASGPAE